MSIQPMLQAGDVFDTYLGEVDLSVEVQITETTDQGLYFKPTSGVPLPTTTHVPERGYFSSWSNVSYT